jgi:hypothetical protein
MSAALRPRTDVAAATVTVQPRVAAGRGRPPCGRDDARRQEAPMKVLYLRWDGDYGLIEPDQTTLLEAGLPVR